MELADTSFITGVGLRLHGMPLVNNSYVDRDSIDSDNDSALLCHTDNTDCCNRKHSQTVTGNWYSVTGDALDINMVASGHGMGEFPSQSSLSVSRGPGVVRLLRQQQASPMELGQLYCEVPDVRGVSQRLFINLSEL